MYRRWRKSEERNNAQAINAQIIHLNLYTQTRSLHYNVQNMDLIFALYIQVNTQITSWVWMGS